MNTSDADRKKMTQAFSKIDLDLDTAVGILSFLKSEGIEAKDARRALSIASAIIAGTSTWDELDPNLGVK